MASSGTVLDWQSEGLDGPVVDKHSTGGVGDKVSFLLAPIAAACGCYVPMIRAADWDIPAGPLTRSNPFRGTTRHPISRCSSKVVKSIGCAIIGQTADLAPADRRLYAIRDVTATVESIPLITASILSKKDCRGNASDWSWMSNLAAGHSCLEADKAEELAKSIIATAATAKLQDTCAIITDMNECLGLTAGNAVEIAESMEYLKNNQRESRLDEVVMCIVRGNAGGDGSGATIVIRRAHEGR